MACSCSIRSLSFDAKKPGQFKPSNSAEAAFYKQLKKVAKESGKIVKAHADGASIVDEKRMMKELEKYSQKIGPWAVKQSKIFLEQISRSNKRAYRNKSENMAKLLNSSLAETNMLEVSLTLLDEQVALIKSLPLEAGRRAQDIAAKNFLEGTRPKPDPSVIDQLKTDMGMSTEVATNRAKLIARTESARANEAFVQTRAVSIGSPGYIWMSEKSPNSRPAHVAMHGKFVAWDSPPVLRDGTQGHAGTFPNCLCWQDPVLPDSY